MSFLLFSWLCFSFSCHDIQIAIFKIQEEVDYLQVNVVFEKDDVHHTFLDSDQKLEADHLKAYLQNNFSISINQEKQNLIFSNMQIKEKHIHLTARLPKPETSITLLEIQNTCLLNIQNHSNIIKLRLLDQERDFLMNDKRTQISVNY